MSWFKDKAGKVKQNLTRYKINMDEVYRQAYNSGWNDCKEHSPFGASYCSSIGYLNGFKDKKRYLRSEEKHNKQLSPKKG